MKAGELTLIRVSPTLSVRVANRLYAARVYGEAGTDGHWHGWIAFFPAGEGDSLVTPQETSQPNLLALEYWAAGLTEPYLQGAFRRAQDSQPEGILERLRRRLDEDAQNAREEARRLYEAAAARERIAEATEELRSRLVTPK